MAQWATISSLVDDLRPRFGTGSLDISLLNSFLLVPWLIKKFSIHEFEEDELQLMDLGHNF